MTAAIGSEGTEPMAALTGAGVSPTPAPAELEDDCTACTDPWTARFSVHPDGVTVYDAVSGERLDTVAALAAVLNEQNRQAEQLAHVESMMVQAAEGLVQFGQMFEQLTANGGGMLGRLLGMPKSPT